jgi:mannose-1-phosphate guanylyltransferase
MDIYAIIMAGGVGSRFWPRSKERTPKQLLTIFGEDTMIQSTVKRIEPLVKPDHIFIVTNKVQTEEMIRQLPQIPKENILVEPYGRNTAACIGLACLHIRKVSKDAVTFVLPADHLIHEEEKFIDNLNTAIQFAYEKKGLVTIGIVPTRPETGYGYIQVSDDKSDAAICPVNAFAEKPNYSTAVRFLKSGDFYWNSGMFIWRVDTILSEIASYMPDLSYCLQLIEAAMGTLDYDKVLTENYAQLKSISIDYGIMEKSRDVYLVKSTFRWSDVGSWEEVYQLSDKNEDGDAIAGEVFTESTHDNYIYSPGRFTAVIGTDNLIVINTKDATLVCRRDQAQSVKKVVDYLKQTDKTELL